MTEPKSTVYVRIPTPLHRKARIRALTDGVTLAKLIEFALELYLVASRTTDAEAL